MSRDVLIVHATTERAHAARKAMPAAYHASLGEAWTGMRFDTVVVASRPSTEGSIAELRKQLDQVEDLHLKLRPGGQLIFLPGADPRGE